MGARAAAWLCASALLAGCGPTLDRDSFNAVETGMSETEVIGLLGEPDRSRSVTVGGMSGTHLAWQGDGFVVAVQFVDEGVVSKQWIGGGD